MRPAQLTKFSVGSALSILAACAAPAERPGAQATISTDEFSKDIAIEGPLMGENPLIGIGKFYYLMTFVDKRSFTYRHFIAVTLDYAGNLVDFRYAADDTAQNLALIPIKRVRAPACTVMCNKTEVFQIGVPDTTLHAHAGSGYRVRVSSLDGEYTTLDVTPAMIAAQYAALDQVLATLPTIDLPVPEFTAAAPVIAPHPAAPETKPDGLAPGIGLQMMPGSTSQLTHGDLKGVVVLGVMPQSPAEVAGLRAGDLIVTFDGHAVDDAQEVLDLVARAKSHGPFKADIQRGPANVRVEIRL